MAKLLLLLLILNVCYLRFHITKGCMERRVEGGGGGGWEEINVFKIFKPAPFFYLHICFLLLSFSFLCSYNSFEMAPCTGASHSGYFSLTNLCASFKQRTRVVSSTKRLGFSISFHLQDVILVFLASYNPNGVMFFFTSGTTKVFSWMRCWWRKESRGRSKTLGGGVRGGGG